jgi:hypothetical protein
METKTELQSISSSYTISSFISNFTNINSLFYMICFGQSEHSDVALANASGRAIHLVFFEGFIL